MYKLLILLVFLSCSNIKIEEIDEQYKDKDVCSKIQKMNCPEIEYKYCEDVIETLKDLNVYNPSCIMQSKECDELKKCN